jgi:hypothetical protein
VDNTVRIPVPGVDKPQGRTLPNVSPNSPARHHRGGDRERDARPGDRADSLRLAPAAGYGSGVCSITGEAIDRIAAAIDQLEAELRADSRAPDMSARVAGIWLMVTALDPGLEVIVSRYTTPASSDLRRTTTARPGAGV